MARPVEWGIAARHRPGERTSGGPRGRPSPRGGCARRGDRRARARRRGRARRAHGRGRRAHAPDGRPRDAPVGVPRRPARHPRRGDQPRLPVRGPRRGELARRRQRRGSRAQRGPVGARRPKSSLPLAAGIPGYHLPAVSTATLPVTPGDVLVLATDGIDATFADALDTSGSTQTISERILADHGRRRDDALVVASATRGRGRERHASGVRRVLRDGAGAPSARPRRGVAAGGLRARARRRRPAARSALDLAVAHQEALVVALGDAGGAAEVERVTRAAGDFFLEGLAAFEMIQRGFAEAQRTAAQGRRRTELARGLTTFLADASLALDADEALAEMLQLVAEQARELVDADCCLATVVADGRSRAAEGASHVAGDMRWAAFVRWLDVPAIRETLRRGGGSARAAGDDLAALAPLLRPAGHRCAGGWRRRSGPSTGPRWALSRHSTRRPAPSRTRTPRPSCIWRRSRRRPSSGCWARSRLTPRACVAPERSP